MSFQIRLITLLSLLLISITALGQSFYLGSDLSYVNEMEDCGAVYKEDGQEKDPYAIFADHGNNLVRLRLWHTPSWYDQLNEGKRYSDLMDVRKSIQRAKAEGMKVLLDFHLSDNWADTGKQVVPQAWSAVVDDLPVLKDSLYNYLFQTLSDLNADGLLPEMVQVGNETNRGILLSQEVNDAGWTLEWERNASLFNAAIQAVRAVETVSGKKIEIVIHAAGPENADWIFDEFIQNGVTDFDIMGISYYWAWHKPATIEQTGEIIEALRTEHPNYEIMIMETGYLWTTDAQDNANNIINEVHPDYSPASPNAQYRWLVDLTKSVKAAGGLGVLYWEPAWISTSCFTQWGQGSHQEHATFFDFDHNLIPDGGIAWLSYDYEGTTSAKELDITDPMRIFTDNDNNLLILEWPSVSDTNRIQLSLIDSEGRVVLSRTMMPEWFSDRYQIPLLDLATGVYFVVARQNGQLVGREKVWIGKRK